jgi:hypothetical protein
MVLICMSACAALCAAQTDAYGRWENGITEAWWFDATDFPAEHIGEAQARWHAIGAQSGGAKNGGWHGDYSSGGDTHGTYMRWSPQAGYVLMHINKCEARVMGFSYGAAGAAGALVEFKTEISQSSSHSHGHAHTPTPVKLRFLPVTWRGVRYLVGEHEIEDFFDYVAGLGKFNRGLSGFMIIDSPGFFYQITGQAAAQDKGSPVVPPGYERFIKKPIEAEITSVGTGHRRVDRENEWWDNFVIPVTVSVGRAHGVKRKMSLRVDGLEGFGGMGEIVEIKQVGLRSSGGVVVRTVRKIPCVKFSDTDDCEEAEYQPLKVGLRLTTELEY